MILNGGKLFTDLQLVAARCLGVQLQQLCECEQQRQREHERQQRDEPEWCVPPLLMR
jgi:hypothetical protein